MIDANKIDAMTPDQYQAVQDAFLEIRGGNETQRKEKLAKLENDSPAIAEHVRQLLDSDSAVGSFLEKPLVEWGPEADFATEELRRDVASSDKYPTQMGPYRILQKIGEGGHGVVFMAEQSKPIRRQVAIKWVKPGMDSKMILAHFEAERQALAMMNHPSIANVVDAGSTEAGQPYFVMELVHGIPIDQFCEENKLELTERLQLFSQVCEAVHHAHRKGIIHRDIKPANVLVTVDSGKPLAKVIDFGIAKALHLPLTERTMYTEYGQIIGTLEYMSPEQALMSQSGTDVRSDVYSLGVLLYLLLTGETPLSKKKLLEKGIWELRNVLQNTRPETPSLRITSQQQPRHYRDHSQSPRTWLHHVQGDLDWITMKALAKEPENRYDSAAEFADDIDHYLRGDRVVARPPSTWYSLKKFVRRHRVAAVIAVTVAASLLTSLLALTWGFVQSQRSLVAANEARDLVRAQTVELEAALEATETERQRADDNARRLARMLERQILETSWTAAMNGDVSTAQDGLKRIAPEDRGFAWEFVESVSKPMALPVLRHERRGTIREIAVHPELGMVAVVNTQSELEVWNAAATRQSASLQLPQRIYTAIGLSGDGNYALVGGSPDAVTLVDIRKETQSATRALGLGGIRAIAHDPNSHRWLITTGANHVVSLDEQTLETLARVQLPKRISHLAVGPAGNRLVVSALDGDLFVVSLPTLDQFDQVTGFDGEVAAFLWREDRLEIGDWDGNLFVLDVANYDNEQSDSSLRPVDGAWADGQLRRVGELRERPAALHIATDGTVFAAWRDGQVAAHNPETGAPFPLRQFSGAIRYVAYLENSGQLLVAHPSGRIMLIGRHEIERARQQAQAMVDLRDGLTLTNRNLTVTAHADGRIKLWNAKTGAALRAAQMHQGEVLELGADAAGGLVASVGADRQLVVATLPTLEVVHRLSVNWGVRCVAFAPHSALLAAAPDSSNQINSREGTVDLWDMATGRVRTRLAGHTNWVTEIRFIGAGERLVTLSVDGTARVWSTSGECQTTIPLSGAALATTISVADAANELVVGHDDGSISVWNMDTGKQRQIKAITGDSIIGIAAPTGAGRLTVAAQSDPHLLVLDLADLSLLSRFDGGVGKIVSLRTNSANNHLQIVGEQGLVRVWPFVGPENVSERSFPAGDG